jgi:hypothetical protein
MKMTTLAMFAILSIASAAFAEGKKEEKKVTGHREKTSADGDIEDIDAEDKADCKAKGGKWNKAAKGDHAHE